MSTARPDGRLARLAELAYFAGEYATLRFVPRERPGRLFGRMFKLPLLQQRLGLGRMSRQLLILETTGRKTGRTRSTPLGFQHDAASDTFFVSAGWYGRTDWYRNLRADPRVRVHHAGRVFACTARPLDVEEALPLLRSYAERNPFALRVWQRWIDAPLDRSDASLLLVAHAFPMVALPAPRATI